MKVMYAIFVSSGGRGGHFHSLNHISREISKSQEVDAEIITIGAETSEVLIHNPLFNEHLDFSRANYLRFYSSFRKLLKKRNPDIIHFFDAHSFNVYMPFFYFSKRKVVVNRCGGPNPTMYPVIPNLILFSKENKDWFHSKVQYDHTKMDLIPNRVSKIQVQKYEAFQKDSTLFNVVRICRIGKTYYHSIENGINLLKGLKRDYNINSKLYVIGKVVEQDEFEKLQELAKGHNVEFLVEDEYTNNASKMLYLADMVIGTGRSAMEAFSVGKPVSVPSKKFLYPILVNRQNFKLFFDKNFTHRADFNSLTNDELIQDICQLVKDENRYRRYADFSVQMFQQHFDIQKVSERYISFYNELSIHQFSLKSLRINLRNFLSTTSRIFRNRF
jgi:glycosyltransferase involved in cell wall biosynthesis